MFTMMGGGGCTLYDQGVGWGGGVDGYNGKVTTKLHEKIGYVREFVWWNFNGL